MVETTQARIAQIDETLAPAVQIGSALGPVNASQLLVVVNCIRQALVNALLPLPEVVEPEAEEPAPAEAPPAEAAPEA